MPSNRNSLLQGEVCLSLPTAEVLALAADSNQRSSVISILETTVVGWSKLIEVTIGLLFLH
jgi:hypothetical protein